MFLRLTYLVSGSISKSTLYKLTPFGSERPGFGVCFRNQLVAGSLAAEVPVQDVWVLERSFMKAPHSKWRLAGRLGGVAPTAANTSWRERLSRLLYGARGPVLAAS